MVLGKTVSSLRLVSGLVYLSAAIDKGEIGQHVVLKYTNHETKVSAHGEHFAHATLSSLDFKTTLGGERVQVNNMYVCMYVLI